MSHIICVKCGSNDHIGQYGLGGARTWCESCDTVIEWHPDTDGLPRRDLARVKKAHRKWKKRTYRGKPISSFFTPAYYGAAGQAGFTLIELMVVVTIIGILATISIPITRAELCRRGAPSCATSAWISAGPDRICQALVGPDQARMKRDAAGAPICRKVMP